MRTAASIDARGGLQLHLGPSHKTWLQKHKGQRVECEIRDAGAIHTDRTRRYYFGCVVPTVQQIKSQERGIQYSKNAIHGMLMRVFCADLLETAPDGESERPSLSGLPQRILSRVIEQVKEWLWQDYQVLLPDPEEWHD